MNILGLIPARGGSKGIPLKNIMTLASKPLIAYSIETAKKSKYIDKVVVSTEHEEIAEISKFYETEVIKRPEQLAGDETSTIEIIFHVFDVINYNPEIVVLLQPTSPLRTPEDVDNAIELLLKNDCESVVSVCKAKHPPYWSFEIKEKYLKPIFSEKYLRMRRQELPNAYIPNGAIFISMPKILWRYKSFYCEKTIPYVMPPERSIDIDDEIDFMLAELLTQKMTIDGLKAKNSKGV